MPAHRKYFNLPDVKTCPECGREFPRPANYGHDRWHKAQVCSLSCASKRGNARRRAERLSLHEEFWQRVDKSPGQGPYGDCWEWTGARFDTGYGRIGRDHKTIRATHIALEIDGRPLGEGEMACHRCDNPPCVRPDHLFPAPGIVNMQDMAAKGRAARGDRSGMVKLTEDQVRAIRADNRPGTVIAREYGVHHNNIYAIKRRETWKHLD